MRIESAAWFAGRQARFLVSLLIVVMVSSLASFAPVSASQVTFVEGQNMPEVTVYDAEGNAVKLQPQPGRHMFLWYVSTGSLNVRSGRVVLPALSQAAADFREKGLDIVFVTPDRGMTDWLEFMDFDFQVLWDDDGVLADITGRGSVTVGVGVAANGKVRSIIPYSANTANNALPWAKQTLNEVLNWPHGVDDSLYLPELIEPGALLPQFGLRSFDGQYFLSTDLEGSAVCYVFWNPYCGFAVSTMVRLRELFPEFNARGVEFVAVANDFAFADGVQAWLGSNLMPFIHLRDDFNDVSSLMGFYGNPGMVIVNQEGLVTFAGQGNSIHEADLRPVLEEVAGPPIAGGWPGQPGADPLHDLEPLVEASGNFFGLEVFFDPLLSDDARQELASGLIASVEEIAGSLGMEPDILAEVDAQLTFYSDPMRYFNDSSAPCDSLGYCIFYADDFSFRMYVQWVTDLETTLTVARHELVHAFLKLRIGQVPPVWFDEGCADTFTRPTAVDYWGVYLYFDQPPSAATVEKWWTDGNESHFNRLAAREISHAVVDYMFWQYGSEGFNSLLDSMATGSTLESAVSDVWGISFARFWSDFWQQVPDAYERAADGYEYVSAFDDVSPAKVQFSDMVENLVTLGLYPSGGNYRPQSLITRGEFADLLLAALNLPGDLADTLYAPQETISHYQAAAMIVHAMGLPLAEQPGQGDLFVDMEETPQWAQQHLWTAIVFNLIDEMLLSSNGYDVPPPSVFKRLSRAEAAVWIVRAYHLRLSWPDTVAIESLNLSGQPVPESKSPSEEIDNGEGTDSTRRKSPAVFLQLPWVWWLLGGAAVLLAVGGALWFVKFRSASK